MKSSNGLIFVVIVFVLNISACSTTLQAYKQNIDIYFDSKIGVTISNEEIEQSVADLIHVKNGERPLATMALAFIENGQYKWYSRDKVIFITENGRLVRTAGLNHNLMYVSNLAFDPLKTKLDTEVTPTWKRVIDTEFGDFGVDLSSQFSVVTNDTISIQENQFVTTKYIETVSYHSELHGDDNWINIFWIHQESGQLIRSSQKVFSQGETIEITYLSRAIRLLEK